jgi:hypothetical protein
MSQTTFDDFQRLGCLDFDGWKFEMDNLNDLNRYRAEFGFWITYHNPENQHEWKRTKGHGTDLTLELRNRDGTTYRIHIEESYCSKHYWYRRRWFEECRLKRFEGKPHGRYDVWIILTNRPHNFKGLRNYLKQLRIKLFNMGELLYYIKRLRNSSFTTKAAAFSYRNFINQQYNAGNTSNTTITSNTDNHEMTANNNNVYAPAKGSNETDGEDDLTDKFTMMKLIDRYKSLGLFHDYNT